VGRRGLVPLLPQPGQLLLQAARGYHVVVTISPSSFIVLANDSLLPYLCAFAW
jgi:hypothetical protein